MTSFNIERIADSRDGLCLGQYESCTWVAGAACQFDHSDGLAACQSSARGMHLLKQKSYLVYYEGNDIEDLDGREQHSPLLKRYLDLAFSRHLIDRQQEIDQALIPCHPERKMELQATSLDVEELLNIHHLRALASFGHRQGPGQKWLAGRTDRAVTKKQRSGVKED